MQSLHSVYFPAPYNSLLHRSCRSLQQQSRSCGSSDDLCSAGHIAEKRLRVLPECLPVAWLVPKALEFSALSSGASPALKSEMFDARKLGSAFQISTISFALSFASPCSRCSRARPSFAIREPGSDASSALNSRSAPGKIVLIEQEQSHNRRVCPEEIVETARAFLYASAA